MRRAYFALLTDLSDLLFERQTRGNLGQGRFRNLQCGAGLWIASFSRRASRCLEGSDACQLNRIALGHLIETDRHGGAIGKCEHPRR